MKKLIFTCLLFITGLANAQTWIAGSTTQGQFGSGYTNLRTNFGAKGNVTQYTQFQVDSLLASVGGLADGVVSGLVTTISGSNAITTAGTWRINKVVYAKNTPTTTPLEAQDATLFRQDILYATTAGTILKAVGTLGPTFTAPNIPDNTIPIANIFISPTSVTTAPPVVNAILTTNNQTKDGILTLNSPLYLNQGIKFLNQPNISSNYLYTFVGLSDGTVQADTVKKASQVYVNNTFSTRLTPNINVDYPASFLFRPFQILEKNQAYYANAIQQDIIALKMANMQPFYSNYNTGTDSPTNGTTPTTPVKTIAYAYNTLNARFINDETIGVEGVDTWGSLNAGFINTDDFFVIGMGRNKTYITSAPASAPTWTLGTSATYSATVTACKNAVDMAFTDSLGFPLRLPLATTLANCQATAGTMFISGTTINVHLTDGRSPDSKVTILTSNANATYSANAGYHYVQGITFMGGGTITGAHGTIAQTGVNNTAVSMSYNCNFLYAESSGGYNNNGGEGTRETYTYLSWHKNDIAYGNARDGFNYEGEATYRSHVIEENCQSFSNGLRLTSTSVNASSAHNLMDVIRINCKGYNNSGPNFADVNGTITFNLGCEAWKCLSYAAAGTNNQSDYIIDNQASGLNTEMWNVGCKSADSLVSFRISSPASNAIMHIDKTTTYRAPFSGAVVIGNYSVSNVPSFVFPALSGYTANTTYQPFIAPGTITQYWRGDKTWQAINWVTLTGTNNPISATNTWTGANTVTSAGSWTFAQGTIISNPPTEAGTFALVVRDAITNVFSKVQTLPVSNGGTGVTTITGLVKGNGTAAFTAATAGTDYQIPITLTTTGTSGAATFSAGTLNIPNYTGGFTNPMTTLGDIIYGGASGTATRLAGNTTTTSKVLFQTGNGTVSAAPVWTDPYASAPLTGTPTTPTATAGTSTTQIASTAFVTTADNLKANIASPTLTGVPAAPTAAPGANTTQIATTAFVTAAVTASGVTFANPTGTIGLTTVNGSATTAMRSDATPPLSQAIVPTWTGQHTYSFPNLGGYSGATPTAAIILNNPTVATVGVPQQVSPALIFSGHTLATGNVDNPVQMSISMQSDQTVPLINRMLIYSKVNGGTDNLIFNLAGTGDLTLGAGVSNLNSGNLQAASAYLRQSFAGAGPITSLKLWNTMGATVSIPSSYSVNEDFSGQRYGAYTPTPISDKVDAFVTLRPIPGILTNNYGQLVWQFSLNGGTMTAPVMGINDMGQLSVNTTTTTVSGSTSGSAVFSQPFNGTTYKVVNIMCNALVGTSTYTFPTAFSNTPVVISTSGLSTGTVTSISTTSVTVTGATTSGYLEIHGY